MKRRSVRRAALVTVVLLGVLLGPGGAGPAGARASASATSSFRIKYGVATHQKFAVVGDGKVSVTSRATGGGIYFVQVMREDCGAWGCHGYKAVGSRKQLTADGVSRSFTLAPGNNSRLHQLWISKPDDGSYISGSVSFR